MKASILAVLALVLSQSAFAQYHRGHRYYGPRVGVYFGSPFIGAPYLWYPPPAYYYPPNVVYSPVVVREPPAVYIEQAEEAAPPAPVRQNFESGYWYYCHERSAYYPTVTSCPGAWQKVAPTSNQNR